jgi:hypothetical protein
MGQPAADAHSALREVATRHQSRRDDHTAFKAIMLRSSPSVYPWRGLTDMLERTVSDRTRANELERLLPWTWKMVRPIDT